MFTDFKLNELGQPVIQLTQADYDNCVEIWIYKYKTANSAILETVNTI
jgi:hypothetical protein